MEIIASYRDFTFYKDPNYTVKFGNQTLVLSEHFGIDESKINETISSYPTEQDFLKDFMSWPKLIKNNQIILASLEEAKEPEDAKNGLLGRASILQGHGLLIHNCSSIHMFGMQFPINVYFLDRGFRVIAKFENVPPETFTPYIHDAYYALETAVYPYDIKVGDQLDSMQIEFE